MAQQTALQELINWTNQYEGKMISADQVVLKIYKLLKKEKEQMFAFTEDRNVIGKYSEKFFREEFEQYYNETYNK